MRGAGKMRPKFENKLIRKIIEVCYSKKKRRRRRQMKMRRKKTKTGGVIVDIRRI